MRLLAILLAMPLTTQGFASSYHPCVQASQFVKLARDCQIVGTTLSEANPPLTEADCNVSFTAEVTQQHKTSAQKGGDRKKMNYNDFLTVLMKMSVKVYPRSKTVDAAFQRLLMDNVLPLASRRAPDTIDMFLENEDVRRLFEYYADALEQIFSFYASSDKRTHAAIAAGNAAAAQGGTGAGLSYTGRAGTRNTKSVNSMKEALGYREFLKFCKDFDLSDSVILSTIELGACPCMPMATSHRYTPRHPLCLSLSLLQAMCTCPASRRWSQRAPSAS